MRGGGEGRLTQAGLARRIELQAGKARKSALALREHAVNEARKTHWLGYAAIACGVFPGIAFAVGLGVALLVGDEAVWFLDVFGASFPACPIAAITFGAWSLAIKRNKLGVTGILLGVFFAACYVFVLWLPASQWPPNR
jgi:hypothetical protein